jgi:hypothetical protein
MSESTNFLPRKRKNQWNQIVIKSITDQTGYTATFIRQCLFDNSNRQGEQHDAIRKEYAKRVAAVEKALEEFVKKSDN